MWLSSYYRFFLKKNSPIIKPVFADHFSVNSTLCIFNFDLVPPKKMLCVHKLYFECCTTLFLDVCQQYSSLTFLHIKRLIFPIYCSIGLILCQLTHLHMSLQIVVTSTWQPATMAIMQFHLLPHVIRPVCSSCL